jgi:hypothetical protein
VRDVGRLSRKYETEPASFADISVSELVYLEKKKKSK